MWTSRWFATEAVNWMLVACQKTVEQCPVVWGMNRYEHHLFCSDCFFFGMHI